ncbi:hypothetical protein ACFSX9_05330 [Flavobacterium ardleyense]|uniref:PEGA domain-containing protein n=1 Tax=Flavobacterium ardleyense TaxID=2038737 RepID=A0ABW5Z6V4_9FLAO
MKYYISLFQKLKDIYESQSGQSKEAVLLCPSQRVFTNEELSLLGPKNITNQDNLLESFNKKRDISYQLNSIPISDSFWDINPSNSLFDRYREILQAIKPKKIKESLLNMDDEIESILFLKGKETKEFKEYKKYLDLLQDTINLVEQHLAQFDALISEQQKDLWTEKLFVLQTKTKLAYTNLEVKGYKSAIEAVLEKINKKSDLENYLQLLSASKSFFDIAEKTDIDTLASYHDISFVPYDFMKSESGWNKLKLSKSELENDYQLARKSNDNLPQEILSIDYDEKYITGIELEYSFVHLKRGWFNKKVLESEFLELPDDKQISDGATISNEFMLSAFPKTMILIKNLKINIDSNIDLEQNNSNQIIQFGPLVMKAQLFTNHLTKVRFVKAITNKDTLLSNQLNYKVSKANLTDAAVKIPLTKTIDPLVMQKANPTAFSRFSRNPKEILSKRSSLQKDAPANAVVSQFIIMPHFVTAINQTVIIPSNTKINIKLINKIAKEIPIYQCSVSILGIGTNFSLDIETNQESLATCKLPLGSYKIEFRINGYKPLTTTIKVENTNNMTLEYTLEPDEVTFESYFLIGMVCERMSKNPQ